MNICLNNYYSFLKDLSNCEEHKNYLVLCNTYKKTGYSYYWDNSLFDFFALLLSIIYLIIILCDHILFFVFYKNNIFSFIYSNIDDNFMNCCKYELIPSLYQRFFLII